MNSSEIRAYVREYLDLTAEDLSNLLLDRWIGEGQRQVLAARPRWKHLEAIEQIVTVDGTHSYELPEIRTVQAVDCAETGSLALIDHAEATARFRQADGTVRSGRPMAVSSWGGRLYVWPKPDDDYTLDVQGQRPAVAPTSSSEPDVPEELHDAVLEWVMHKAYLQQDDPEMATVHRNLFQETVVRFADREDDDLDGTPLVFGGGPLAQRRGTHAYDDRLYMPEIGLV